MPASGIGHRRICGSAVKHEEWWLLSMFAHRFFHIFCADLYWQDGAPMVAKPKDSSQRKFRWVKGGWIALSRSVLVCLSFATCRLGTSSSRRAMLSKSGESWRMQVAQPPERYFGLSHRGSIASCFMSFACFLHCIAILLL